MSQKVLLIFKEGEEMRFTLEKERLLIGRDKSCDVVLGHASISRKHAAIIHRHGSVYIENISSTGKILKAGEPIEYIELGEGVEVLIGPYSLQWRQDERSASQQAPSSNSPAMAAGEEEAAIPVASDEIAPQPLAEPVMAEIPNEEQVPQANEASVEPEPVFAVVSADDKTQLGASPLKAILRVTKGESIGREIRLDNGVHWIVGRSARCHIRIDNHKLSRQHFKIIKIGNSFRVEDMGSANGTRVNGVAVSDAPLQPFDAIQAGPVELQFLMAEANLQPQAAPAIAETPSAMPQLAAGEAAPAMLTFEVDGQQAPPNQERTMFAPPAVYQKGAGSGGAAAFGMGQTNARGRPAGMTNIGAAPVAGSAGPSLRDRLDGARAWFEAQPKQKKLLYGVAAAVVLIALFTSLSPDPHPAADQVAVTPPSQRAPASESLSSAQAPLDQPNAAQSPDISPEFNLLSTGKQNEIRELYAMAERARAAKEWKAAFEAGRAILQTVKRYKNAAEIVDEAQSNLNEESIGNISKSLSNVKDAQREAQDQLELLLASGEKALNEGRFEDAQETFSKALNLDPTNARATRGFAAAHARDKNAVVNVPGAMPESDENSEARQRERDELDGLKRQFQEARGRMNEGKFREGLPLLKDLDEKLHDRLADYRSLKRGPASIRDEFSGDVMSLQSRVREALDTVKSQLRAEYQTQLTDAEQFESNRQYVQAREIYDRIIRAEPNFDEPFEARAKLYVKMITEAKTIYQEALIYESVGDLDNAIDGYQKARDMLGNVYDPVATEYYKRAMSKLKRLRP